MKSVSQHGCLRPLQQNKALLHSAQMEPVSKENKSWNAVALVLTSSHHVSFLHATLLPSHKKSNTELMWNISWCDWLCLLEKKKWKSLGRTITKMQKLFLTNLGIESWRLTSDQIRSDQSLSRVRLFATPWIPARQASLSITSSRSSLRLTSIESVMPSSHLILCHPLLVLPSIPPSIRVFSNESTLLMKWPKYCSFSLSIIPSKEISGLISFRMDWLDLLAVQGTLKSLLQHHSSKASIFWRSAFFTIQLSHAYMTTGKTIALTRWTFIGKVISLLLNMPSRLVITFLPRSKCLLISWLQSPSAVIMEPRKIKSDTVSTVSPSICYEVMGQDAMIFVFWMLSFKPTFSLSSFTFIKKLFSSSSLSAIRVVSFAYLRLLIFLLAILIPAYVSSSPAFLMMYSAYKLNKQGDNIQPWCSPFPIWNQSVSSLKLSDNSFLPGHRA